MSGLAGFYNNLFTIQVTVFGIIIAAVFVLVQIAAAFSDRHSLRLLTDRILIIYFILSVPTLVLTATGGLLLSFQKHNFVPFWNLHFRPLLTASWTPALLLFLTGMSVLMFIWFVYRNLRYLHPHRILLLASQSVKPHEIRLFLFNEYGIDPPHEPSHLTSSIRKELLNRVLPFLDGSAADFQ
jgi:hypothetical protein